MVTKLMDGLPSGSYVAISHPTGDFNPQATQGAVDAATAAGITLVPRSREGVESFFSGLELVEPGVVPLLAWHPDESIAGEDPESVWYYGGVGRKP
jgi:hypothetical protein